MLMGNIVLTGFMGCGKTTVGVRLSYRLRQPMVDTDKLIEKEEGRTISEIFGTEGEAFFRDLETACLKKLMRTAQNTIISVGGGLPVREENRALLKKHGTVVYLRANAETIYERTKYDASRPLLQGDDPQGKIRTLLEARKDIYEKASDIIIDVDDKDFDTILDEIAKATEKGALSEK